MRSYYFFYALLLTLSVSCSSLHDMGGEGEPCFENNTCKEVLVCNAGICCRQDCEGRECGPDGCGGSCPPGCVAGETCNEITGLCEGCTPDCTGKECGPDGCGGTCPPGCGSGEWCNNGICEVSTTDIVWIQITGGTFMMGSNAGNSTEMPVHQVTVPTFEMSKTEVTVSKYQACVDALACTDPDDYTVNSYCNWGQSDRNDHPVNCVDWHQASSFCQWAGGRLPSEAEWEYAARSGGQDITYPWGNDTPTCQYAVMRDGTGWGCGQDRTWSVCSKTAGNTTQGLCDMAGNLWEWVQDWYHDTYTGAPSDGSAWESPVGDRRVLHGGSWDLETRYLRSSLRFDEYPDVRQSYSGFRCAR